MSQAEGILSRGPIIGRDRVVKVILAFLRDSRVTLVPMPVNGEPGAVVYREGRLAAVIALSVRDGLICQTHAVASPRKLAHAASLLGIPAGANGARPQPAAERGLEVR